MAGSENTPTLPGARRPPKPPAPEPNPDAELIRLCDEFIALEQAAIAGWNALGAESEQAEANAEAVTKQQEPLVTAIGGTPAHTDAGIVAKLRAIAVYGPSLLKPDVALVEDLLLASALRDAVGIAVARPGPEQFQSARVRNRAMVEACATSLEAQWKARGYQTEADRLREHAYNIYRGGPLTPPEAAARTGGKP